MKDVLKASNFLLYAAKNYRNPDCMDIKEFHDDVNRIKYIKRLFNKYREDPAELKERLVINHLVILFNMFGTEPTLKMLFLKMPGYLQLLKPFLLFMGRLPDEIKDVNSAGTVIYTSDIEMDPYIVGVLRNVQ